MCAFLFFVDPQNENKLRKGSNLKILDAKPGVCTEYKPFLHKDKSIVKKLLRGMQNKRPDEVQSALLRRHFLELTQSFMIPLERYMSSLMPLQRNISPFKVNLMFEIMYAELNCFVLNCLFLVCSKTMAI